MFSPGGTLLSIFESFEHYKEHRSIRNLFCNYSESGSLDQMLFQEFYFNSGGYFVQQSRISKRFV